MKGIVIIIILMLIIVSGPMSAFAATTATQGATVSIASVLSVEIDATAGATAFGAGTIPWTSVTPGSNLVYPTGGHITGKSDVGIILKNNTTLTSWQLKMQQVSANGLNGKIKFYLAQPTMNGSATNGTLAYPTPAAGADWPVIPAAATTVYTSGTADKTNVPYGTYCGFSYALDPAGLLTGTAYTGTITYTITTTP